MYQCRCCHCGRLFDSKNKRTVDCGECSPQQVRVEMTHLDSLRVTELEAANKQR
jgi:Zn finger protein HypA/HybF involved in hydrogenase expression